MRAVCSVLLHKNTFLVLPLTFSAQELKGSNGIRVRAQTKVRTSKCNFKYVTDVNVQALYLNVVLYPSLLVLGLNFNLPVRSG